MFENYNCLKILDLSENEIEHLPESIFANLSSLVELNLSGNLLRAIDFNYSSMHALRSIDATRNNFPHMYIETKSKSLGLRLGRIQFTSDKKEWDFRECSCYTLISYLEMNVHRYMFLFSDKCSCPPHTNSFSTISVQDLEILHTFGPHSCPWISIGIVIHMVPFFVTVDIVCMSFTYYVLIIIFTIVPITVSVALNATHISTISVLRILPAFIEMLRHFSQQCVSACIFFVCFRILKLKSTFRKRSKSMISAKMKPIQIFMSRIVTYWSAMIESSGRKLRKTVTWNLFGKCVLVFFCHHSRGFPLLGVSVFCSVCNL